MAKSNIQHELHINTNSANNGKRDSCATLGTRCINKLAKMRETSKTGALILDFCAALVMLLPAQSSICSPNSSCVDQAESKASISGLVTYANAPAPHLVVVAQPGNHRCTTDDAGCFQLKSLPAGNYTVIVRSGHTTLTVKKISLSPGSLQRVDLDIPPPNLARKWPELLGMVLIGALWVCASVAIKCGLRREKTRNSNDIKGSAGV